MEVEVPRTRFQVCLHSWLRRRRQLARRLVQLINVDPIGSQVAEQKIIAGWICLGHVSMRSVVAAVCKPVAKAILSLMGAQRTGWNALHVGRVAQRPVRFYGRYHDGAVP